MVLIWRYPYQRVSTAIISTILRGLTVTFIVEKVALKISSDEATQVYLPESSRSLRFQIFKVPSALTLDLSAGSLPPSFLQVIVGCGSPAAWQRTVIFWSVLTSSCDGGLTVKRGNSTTLSCVTAESCPKTFEASHLYRPESLFLTPSTDNRPSFWRVLACTRFPGFLRQVIFGDGKPVTWHTGKVMFLPLITWDGPNDKDILGWPEETDVQNKII